MKLQIIHRMYPTLGRVLTMTAAFSLFTGTLWMQRSRPRKTFLVSWIEFILRFRRSVLYTCITEVWCSLFACVGLSVFRRLPSFWSSRKPIAWSWSCTLRKWSSLSSLGGFYTWLYVRGWLLDNRRYGIQRALASFELVQEGLNSSFSYPRLPIGFEYLQHFVVMLGFLDLVPGFGEEEFPFEFSRARDDER